MRRIRRKWLRHGWRRIAAGLAACAWLASCQNPAGPDGGSQTSSFAGTAVVVDQGPGFSLVVEAKDFRGDGRLSAELRWSVVAPGRGSLGGQPPDLLLEFLRSCPGSSCGEGTSAGPAPAGPLSVSGEVHSASAYLVRVVSRRACRGCTIEYTLGIRHPPEGSLQQRPSPTCPTFVVTFPSATGPRPVVDPQASPPQVRMTVGERVTMSQLAVGCSFTPPYSVLGWTVTDPSVASVEGDGGAGSVVLRAERPGQTRVIVDVVYIDGSRVQGELGYCPGGDSQCSSPVRLVLQVVR